MATDRPASRRSPLCWFGSLPVAAWREPEICTAERQRIDVIARKLLANEPALTATEAFGPFARKGMASGPVLYIGDHGDTELIPEYALANYDYRIASLAGSGDSTVIYGPRDAAFESYRREILGLGSLHAAELSPAPDCRKQLAYRAARDADLVRNLAERARTAGQLTIVPYQGNGGVWSLAARIAGRSETTIYVAAPPPRLARRINDKTWFARRIVEILGKQARPDQAIAFGPSALAAHVARICRKGRHVVVKVPSSAGSLGNINLAPGDSRGRTAASLRHDLLSRLGDRGWRGTFPLLVEAWDNQVISSPSVQMWLPQSGRTPIIEGVFDQAVEGDESRFVGAVRCTLPGRVIDQLCKEASLLACLLQKLGYFGRCSLDSVVFGETPDRSNIHWIECNGRWGGVSIPMTLSNRLTADWQCDPEILVFRHQLGSNDISTSQLLESMRPVLFRKDRCDGGVAILAPPRKAGGAQLQMVTIAASARQTREITSRARKILEQVTSRNGR